MTTGFGVDLSTDGLTGTSSQDIRRIFGSIYQPGIVKGCVVEQSVTDMSYTVRPGVAAIKVESGFEEIVLAPIDATNIPGPLAPTGADRVDIVYARQQLPEQDGGKSGIVFGVAAGVAKPPNSIELAVFTVKAGNTTSSQAVRVGNANYSVPYGGSMGELWYWQLKNSVTLPTPITRYGHAQINLPTDRMVRWTISAVVSVPGAVRFDDAKYCEYGFLPNYDGGDWTLWSTGGLHQAWQTIQFSNSIPMTAGKHTVQFGMFRIVGPGTGQSHYGIDPAGFGRRGIEFRLIDEGPIK